MARPTKQGIDYFPLDCDFDEKTEMYLVEKGAIGLAVLVTAWQLIYSGEGYFVHQTDDLLLRIKRRIDVEIDVIADCIEACLRRNIFDHGANEAHKILTSKALQTRYFEAAKRKKSVRINPDFLLVDVSAYKNRVNVCNNPVNAGGNATKEKGKGKGKEKENITSRRNKISADFKPDERDYQILTGPGKGIPRYFIDEQVEEFIAYWAEQGTARDDFHAQFRKRVIREWLSKPGKQNGDSERGDRFDGSIVETSAGFLRTIQ